MNLNHNTNKQTGDQLTALEWNKLAEDVNELGAGGSGSSSSDTPVAIDASGVISVNSKGNTTLSAAKHVNIEPTYVADGGAGTYGDVQIKPGDDITFESHHRALDKRDEITIKTSNGQDGAAKAPVKLQVIAADMTLSSKGKTGDDSNVMNVNVTTGNGKGYLKVRAQAIDLRCEEHGGIALQPNGEDGSGNEDKIKFEHGGGDGLEFGTFNTEKTSIFTDEYRFNKEGVWKMATREKLDNSSDLEGIVGVTIGNKKYVSGTSDETQHYSYKKQADDFYDVIAQDDEQCTTKDIIKTAYVMNGGKNRHTKITNKGAIEIATNQTYTLNETSEPENTSGVINISTISTKIATILQNTDIASFNGMIFNDGDFDSTPSTSATYSDGSGFYFTFSLNAAPNIKIDSGAELKLGGILDFGSTFNFGETDNGIEVQYKLTKQNNTKDCGVLKVIGINNNTSNTLTITTANPSTGTVEDYVIPVYTDPASDQGGLLSTRYTPQAIASCSVNDIIMFVNWAKGTGFGPWDAQAIANKEELIWNGSTFVSFNSIDNNENPIVEPQ